MISAYKTNLAAHVSGQSHLNHVCREREREMRYSHDNCVSTGKGQGGEMDDRMKFCTFNVEAESRFYEKSE
jgi:hypothetical protein